MSRQDSSAVRLEGNLFSRDLLDQVTSVHSPLPHLAPTAFGLGQTERVRERIAQSWNTLAARYARYRAERAKLAPADLATAVTRQEWLLPLLAELQFGRVQVASQLHAGGKNYPISHAWNETPLHLLGAGVPLDRRTPGVSGAAQMAPHAMVQEFLNRSPQHTWAIVSNGSKLRVLRDSASIARQSYLEFDLDAIFQNEDTPAFALLWIMCHASRFEQNGAILEKWQENAREAGVRALDKLRDGVEKAIETLASGFLAHRGNTTLHERLENGDLSNQEFYRDTLRLVYRLLFVLVAEAKDALLLPPLQGEERTKEPETARARDAARERYLQYFSLTRLKARAGRRHGDAHPDLWHGLRLVFNLLREGEPQLALPGLGGFLFESTGLDECEISNQDLLAALRHLAYFHDNQGNRHEVNFDLGSEELGSVYESLLELHPEIDRAARHFELRTFAGNDRKTTGSYYTPEILVKSLLESALEPLLARAAGAANREEALLQLDILDPACGSGHFLTAAARRVARELALVRTGGDEPSVPVYRAALRDVVSRCIYGVDINPMAVELCKVALWMEALEPGKPLSFLDAHIRCGNALLGATPQMMEDGIPDEAFAVLEGDDKAIVASLKKRNKAERKQNKDRAVTGSLFQDGHINLGELATDFMSIESVAETDVAAVRQKEERYAKWRASTPYRMTHMVADAWCSAFVWHRVPENVPGFVEPITDDDFAHIKRHALCKLPGQQEEIRRLSGLYSWLHPHLEFPVVWAKGGFDLVLGNPPWERVKLQEKEWFATREPQIANAPNAARRKAMIEELQHQSPVIWTEFLAARRRAEGESHFVRSSGRFPLCGVGDVNTYALFAELNKDFINRQGRVGCIVPSGIATDDTTKAFFGALNDNGQLASLFDLENRQGIFPGVHRSFKFCLLTLAGKETPVKEAQFVFFAQSEADLLDAGKRFTLSSEDIALLNPNTRTCPIFRSTYDAELTKAIYRRVPVLINEAMGPAGNPWGIRFGTMFHMSNDSSLFHNYEELRERQEALSEASPNDGQSNNGLERPTDCELRREVATYLPLYEAKMLHQFDHRWATYDGADVRDVTLAEKADVDFAVRPRYWVAGGEVLARLTQRLPRGFFEAWLHRDEEGLRLMLQKWLLGWQHNHGTGGQAQDILSAYAPQLQMDILQGPATAGPKAVAAAKSMENDLPLSPEELQIISTTWHDPLELAARLIQGRIPKWLLGGRGVCRTTDERSGIFNFLPLSGVGNSAFLIQTAKPANEVACLLAALNSFVCDYVVRQKVGGMNFNFFYINQIAVLPPSAYDSTIFSWTKGQSLRDWVASRVIELCYSNTELMAFARDCEYSGPPFQWDEERRLQLRCELDAAFFRLYGLNNEEAAYVLDTFPIVRRKDEARYGHYRTKDTILALLKTRFV